MPVEEVPHEKPTAFVGSARKKHTFDCVRRFLNSLVSVGDVDYEIVTLSDYNLETCRSCCVCFEKGEEFCLSREDDRDVLIEKMMTSDGVVFASPTYSFQVSAIMKRFLDRLGFVIHRPCFFGKTFTSIVVQGIYGGPRVVEYLDFLGDSLGFNVVTGRCVTALEPVSEKDQRKIDGILAAHSRRFHDGMSGPPYCVPTLSHVMQLSMARTKVRLMLNESYRDYRYYRDKRSFEADYFYPARLNPLKKAAEHLFDYTASRSARNESDLRTATFREDN